MLAALVATVAAANLTLIYLLHALNHPGISIAESVPIIAIGAVPFLLTAGFLAWVIRTERPGEGGQPSRRAVMRLRIITGFALPFMILGGFWSGLAAAFLGLDLGSSAASALGVYQFTFLAAVIADGITLVMALIQRR
jgi:hypothetical protein